MYRNGIATYHLAGDGAGPRGPESGVLSAETKKTPRLAQGRVSCHVDEIPAGTHKVVPIGRHGVGVYNVNGTFYAIANYCPHEGGPLCAGARAGGQSSTRVCPADAVMVRDSEFIYCPWHQWGFELATGTTAVKPEWSIRTYPVRVVGNDVLVNMATTPKTNAVRIAARHERGPERADRALTESAGPTLKRGEKSLKSTAATSYTRFSVKKAISSPYAWRPLQQGHSGPAAVGSELVKGGYRVLLWDRPQLRQVRCAVLRPERIHMRAATLHGLITGLDIGPCIIAGGSGGARDSMLTSMLYPEIVRKLVVWNIVGGVYGSFVLGSYYIVPSILAVRGGGMKGVIGVDEWKERIAENPPTETGSLRWTPTSSSS